MIADKIIKNAKIFTADKDKPLATALVVKDGKFVYVGDEVGLSDYEGEVTDLKGKFIMPGIIDSHVHITTSVGFEYLDLGVPVMTSNKKDALDFIADYVRDNPGLTRYRFMLERASLHGEIITKDELDAICPDSELIILEGEVHSNWVNSRILERHGVTDDTPDPVPGLAYYVRKDGHLTGNSFESQNLGSIILDEKTGEWSIGDVGADAQINLARGTVVTNAKVDPMPEDVAKVAAEFFGPDGRHGFDYMYYYNNIKENVAKRVAAYKANK